jgi:filamentous hemagglutinin
MKSKSPNSWWLGVLAAVVLIGLALAFLRNAPTAEVQPAQANTAISIAADAPNVPNQAEANAKKPTRTPAPSSQKKLTPRAPTRTPSSSKSNVVDGLVVRNVKIYDLDGDLVYKGDVDLKPTLDRIAKGIRDSHRNDGSTFGNFERRLPNKPRGYYTEYVVRTPGLSGVGPQRVIMGRNDEVYYTPDHYVTFVRVK